MLDCELGRNVRREGRVVLSKYRDITHSLFIHAADGGASGFLLVARRDDAGALNHQDHRSFWRARTVQDAFRDDECLAR